MTDDELRAVIRQMIQKHVAAAPAAEPSAPAATVVPVVSIAFGQYHLERPASDSSCLIEPAVACNHCGFCKCHGH